jgi:steroid delta-isomerase-like uncharacterized protein
MNPEEVVKSYWRAWSEHNLAHLLALLAPNFAWRSPLNPGRPADKDRIAADFRRFQKAFPDLKEAVVSLVAKGDRVACEVVETATFTGPLELPTGVLSPTSRPYTIPVAAFFRFDAAGLIVELRSYCDTALWGRQLAIDPALFSAQKLPSSPPPAAKPMKRFRKRLQVTFEGKGGAGMGFTENVSATGMLVRSNAVCAPGTPVRGTLQLPDGGEVRFEAQVRWSHRAEGALAGLKKSSMGLRFMTPPEERFYQLLAKPFDR